MNPSESVVRTPEAASQARTEALPTQGEVGVGPESGPIAEVQQSGGPQLQPVAAPAPITGQLPQIVTNIQPSEPAASSTTPLVAADDEVIEQEWVQKAKKIVSETKDDPYTQEREVGRLQAEYMKKRYGKDIKLVGD